MEKTVMSNLEDILPIRLTHKSDFKRAHAGALIKENLRALVDQSLQGSVTADLNSSTGIGLKTAQQIIFAADEDWTNQQTWNEFLCSVVACLWRLQLDDITAKEIKDDYLRSARQCLGYGITVFYPSVIKTYRRVNNSKSLNDHGDDLLTGELPWITVETELSYDPLKLLISAEGVAVKKIAEKEISQNIKKATLKFLLEITFDDIISWGYNDEFLTIYFELRRERHRGVRPKNCSDDRDGTQDLELQVRETII
jgi:hypothetical protein